MKEKIRYFLSTMLDKSIIVGFIAAIFGVVAFISMGNLFDWGESHMTETDYVELENISEQICQSPGDALSIIEESGIVSSYHIDGDFLGNVKISLHHENGGHISLNFSENFENIELKRDDPRELKFAVMLFLMCISIVVAYVIRAILMLLCEIVEKLVKACKHLRNVILRKR